MKTAISVLIHGPFERHYLGKICKEILKSMDEINQIILVCWAKDLQNYKKLISERHPLPMLKLVSVKDLINPGFFNLNRQIVSVKEGLSHIPRGNIVIKLRNDQSVSFSKLIPEVKKLLKKEPQKIITTNVYSRSDRLYHPSDMLLCGKKELLEEYYSCPLVTETFLTWEMSQIELHNACKQKALTYTPESYLCRKYLEKNEYEFKETIEDSLQALRKFFLILNSWDIGLRSKDKREQFLHKGSIILPYYFSVSPFQYGPVERCRCINRHKLDNKFPTIRDILWIGISRTLWGVNYPSGRLEKCMLWIRYRLLKFSRHVLSVFPYFLVHNTKLKIDNKISRVKGKLSVKRDELHF